MLDFIVKYWLQFLFGLLALGITAFFKQFWKMYKKEHERTQTELCDKLGQEIAESFDKAHKETLSAYQ